MQRSGFLVLAASAVALGAVPVLEKGGLGAGAPPAAFALARSCAALAAVALGWMIVRPDSARRALRASTLGRVALVGAVASGLVLLLSIVALTTTGATSKGVIQALYPVATVGFVWLLYRRAPRRGILVALALVVAGLVLVTSRGLGEAPRTGDLLLLATVPMVGLADAYAKRVLQGIAPLTLTLGRYVFGTVVVAVGFLLLEGGIPLAGLGAWPWAAAAGVVAGAGILGLYVGIERRGPTQAGLVVAASPVVTLGLEAALLGTMPRAGELVGVAAVVAGVALVAWRTGDEGA